MIEGSANLRCKVYDEDDGHFVTLSVDNNGLTLTTPDDRVIFNQNWHGLALTLLYGGFT